MFNKNQKKQENETIVRSFLPEIGVLVAFLSAIIIMPIIWFIISLLPYNFPIWVPLIFGGVSALMVSVYTILRMSRYRSIKK